MELHNSGNKLDSDDVAQHGHNAEPGERCPKCGSLLQRYLGQCSGGVLYEYSVCVVCGRWVCRWLLG